MRRIHVPRKNEDLVGQTLLRVASILLRIGIDAPSAERMFRDAFVRAARDNAKAAGLRVTQSQIASLAGISRVEVRRVLAGLPTADGRDAIRRPSRIDHLVSGWRSDPRFLDKQGKPRALSLSGKKREFASLVRAYGRDVTPNSLRDQLLVRGYAASENGALHLLPAIYRDRPQPIESADLQFLASQLELFDFQLGRRAYVTKHLSIRSAEPKSVRRMRRIALERITTVLKSIGELPGNSGNSRSGSRGKHMRLVVSATIATEAEQKKGISDEVSK